MLYDKLAERAREHRVSFSMPGHKAGAWLPAELRGFFPLDITELPGTDNMHHPEGILKESLEQISSACGAAHSYFSVNGSSAGILAALHFAASKTSILLLDRGCHASAVNALCLTGLEPVYLQPRFQAASGVPGGICPEDVSAALRSYPNAAFVFITSPNYFGLCSDIRRIAKIVHHAGKYLIVDEAHGAHFGFSPLLPENALRQGADIVIQSVHKTLPAPNQTALVHLSARIDPAEFSRFYSLFQTTSPSYPFMAWTDYAVQMLARHGDSIYQSLYDQIYRLNLPFPVLRQDPQDASADQDFSRLVCHTASRGTRGYDAAAHLASRGFDIEMADCNNIVCITTGGNTDDDFAALERALQDCPQGNAIPLFLPPPAAVRQLLPKEAFDAPAAWIPLKEAAGRVSAAVVTSFPPCIPILIPGETITRGQVDYLLDIQRLGGSVTGLEGENCRVVR